MVDVVTERMAAVGEEVNLVFEGSVAMVGTVNVTFSAFALPDDATTSTAGLTPVTWTETLVVGNSRSGRTPTALQSLVKWTTGVESSKQRVPENTYRITMTATGSTAKGQPVSCVGKTQVRVPGFAVTTEPQIHQIMVHEFWTKAGNSYVFDPKPAKRFLASLTPLQRSILIQYPKEASSPGRLVAFITLRGPRPDRPMYADNCAITGTRQMVIANADFSVFHCSKPGDRVTLVMHTEHLCVNKHNSKTAEFFSSLPASALSTTSEGSRQRPRYFLAANLAEFTHGQIYNSILAASGKSIMGGNYLHGMVNTQGCWMLFRNFNWPRSKAKEFFRIYFNDLREDVSDAGVARAKLETGRLGYGYAASGTGANAMSSSWDKYARWDRNYAYGFFFDRIVGLKFLSERCNTWRSALAVRAAIDTVHLHNTHGDVFESQFPEKERFPRGSPRGNRFHDWHLANGNHDVPPPATLWQDNLLGFTTAHGCAGQGAAASCSWADLFFFLPAGLSLQRALEDVYVPLW